MFQKNTLNQKNIYTKTPNLRIAVYSKEEAILLN